MQKALGAKSKLSRKKPSGFFLHFLDLAKSEFVDPIDRRRTMCFDDLECDFDNWLANYNLGEELIGYPTMGSTPKEMIEAARAATVAEPKKCGP